MSLQVLLAPAFTNAPVIPTHEYGFWRNTAVLTGPLTEVYIGL